MPTSKSRAELLAWCVLALLVALLQLPLQRSPRLDSDSFQYLSAAHQLRIGHGMATSLVHFDTERSHGSIPAPLTWFPPGYPMAIAAVSAAGLGYESAALLISIASFILIAGGTWLLARQLDPASPWAARTAALGWIANSHSMEYSASALSESMFTVFGLASLLLLLRADRGTVSIIASAALAGASFWVRYAGLLWVAAWCAIVLLRCLSGRRDELKRIAPAALAGIALLLLFLLPLMSRNLRLVGDWRGGNNTAAAREGWAFAKELPKLPHHLLFGNAGMADLWLPLCVALAGVAVLAGLAFRAGLRLSSVPMPLDSRAVALLSAVVYGGGIAAIAIRSVITFAPRMYVPVLPHLLALAACALAILVSRSRPGLLKRLAACCLAAGYIGANAVSRVAVGQDQFTITSRALAGTPDLKPGEIIAATNGQAAGYALGHPALSIVGRPYSLLQWTEPELRRQMSRFAATRLFVFRDPNLDPVVAQSPFLARLAEGRAPPWLRLMARNQDVCIYAVTAN